MIQMMERLFVLIHALLALGECGNGQWEQLIIRLGMVPHCYTIQKQDFISYTGRLLYIDPHPPIQRQIPIRNARIEMWDHNTVFPNTLLVTDTSDELGYFDMGSVVNEDYLDDKLDIFFRIYSENEAAYLTMEFNGDVYNLCTQYANDLPSGIYDTTIIASFDESGYFYIADVIEEGKNTYNSYNVGSSLGQIQVVHNDGTGTHYNASQETIYVDKRDLASSQYPDSYDKDVIFHEYGHHIEKVNCFFDASPGGTHEWTQVEIPVLAASEGFATFISSVLRSDRKYKDIYNSFNDTSWCDMENGEYGENNTTYGSANHFPDREASVAGILWDIYDSQDDDYSIFGLLGYEWSPDSGYGQDGIMDTLSDGIYTLLSVLSSIDINGSHPDDIEEFWQAWFSDSAAYRCEAMKDVFYEHGIDKKSCKSDPCYPGCCADIRGNVDYDSEDNINIVDLTYLISYLFEAGPNPPCYEEADYNADNNINIIDLTSLVGYLFTGGIAPEPCWAKGKPAITSSPSKNITKVSK